MAIARIDNKKGGHWAKDETMHRWMTADIRRWWREKMKEKRIKVKGNNMYFERNAESITWNDGRQKL